jgi:hypothetical protein
MMGNDQKTLDQVTFTGDNVGEVAEWALAHGVSCTSPLAVEFNGEKFRVSVGGQAVRLLPGDVLTWKANQAVLRDSDGYLLHNLEGGSEG